MTSTLLAPPDSATLVMDGGMPGFPAARSFTISRWGGESSPFSLLRCADSADGGPQFVVVPPAVFFPDYECPLDAAMVARLGLASADHATILVIITLGARPEDATANLFGPIVANLQSGRAAQMVLDRSSYGLRVPLRAGGGMTA